VPLMSEASEQATARSPELTEELPSVPLPFDPAELAALPERDRRLVTRETIARWTANLVPDDVVTAADIARLERGRRQALATIRDGIELTDQEFALLRLLQRHEGQTVTFTQIIRALWPDDARGRPERELWERSGMFGRHANRVSHLVGRIKRALELDPLRPQHLISVRGVGYRWYSAPPSRDDGEDYSARADEARLMRVTIRGHRGELPPPPPSREPDGRFRPGPAQPDFQAIEGDVTRRRSTPEPRADRAD